MDLDYIPSTRYVYFNDLGDILSISNTNKESGNYISVEPDSVTNLIRGKEQLSSYHVIFATETSEYVLCRKKNNEDIPFNINNQVHQLRRLVENKADLTVIQDIPAKEWAIILDSNVRKNLKKTKSTVNNILQFSITEYNDPHILEKLFTIKVSDLVNNDLIKIPFETEIELDPNALSVYTIKKFRSYQHKVINE